MSLASYRLNAASVWAALIAAAGANAALAVEVSPCAGDDGVPAAAARALDDILANTVDADAATAAVYGAAPGAVLSVAGPDWRYVRAAGTEAPETGAPILCDMPFQIGSNTKMMTAAVLLQLYEEGRLSLDDPLSRYLPEIATTLPNGADMTLRQLATHTAGVFSYTDNAPDGTPGIMEGDISDPSALVRGYTMRELVAFAAEHGAPSFPPGAEGQWAYSNTGYVLLGLVIEAIEQRPFAEVLQTRIFDPLGMTATFYATGTPDPALGLPRAYLAAPFDVETTEWNLSQGAAAGAVISTADDMHLFIEALLAGDLFADDATLDLMQQTVATGQPTIPYYGIGLSEKADGIWGHGGQTLGFVSDVAYAPEQDISLVGWATSSTNAMGLGVILVRAALVEGGLLPDPAIAASEELSRAMVGTEWHLVSVDGPDAPETEAGRYTIRFDADAAFQAEADCNRVLGRWHIDRMQLGIEPGPTTLMLCPEGSPSENFVTWLSNATAAEIAPSGELVILSRTVGGPLQLRFGTGR